MGRERLVQHHSWANSCSQAPLQAQTNPHEVRHVPRASPAYAEVTSRKQSPVPAPLSEAVRQLWDLRQNPLPLQALISSSVGQIPPTPEGPCEDQMNKTA